MSSAPTLDAIFAKLTDYPEGFTIHPKLGKQFEGRAALYQEGEIDWATGEALAVGSLVLEGHPVRLAGQDSRRGTFSQRHAALIDYETGEPWIPLDHLDGAEAHFWVFDSLLSEYAAMGFEYGYSHSNPEALVMWEAQFGDFVNGAQIVIDQYIVAAEDKWGQQNGLVLLLPHGYEGQGPEHSSARIERFLTLAAEDNMQIVNATTAANYFHLLRRQVHSLRQTPLIVFTPKQGLRMKQTRSTVDELTAGSFQEILDDPGIIDPDAVTRIVFCSGKVAWDAIAARDERAGAGRHRARRAALPAADRADARRAREVPERPRAALAAGGAREHGRVDVHRAQHVAHQGAGIRHRARRPCRVGQPGHRLQDRPRPGTRRPPRPHLLVGEPVRRLAALRSSVVAQRQLASSAPCDSTN